MFGNSLTSLEQTERRVNVTFRHGLPQTFDLVIEADGLHSITRRLAFGEEHQISHFLGGYLAVFTVPNYLDLHQRMLGIRMSVGQLRSTRFARPARRGSSCCGGPPTCMITIVTMSRRSDD
jgi:2-polyprenyl-6-methoxyphenol hydroxylase-like FAD-dependent oxidoreductase